MQLLFRILSICIFLFINHLNGQNSNILITKDFNEVSLEKVFLWLNDAHGIKIAFDQSLAKEVLITKKLNLVNVDKFLQTVLTGTNLSYYKTRDNKYLVGPKSKQENTITQKFYGRIIDSLTGQHLAYANIYLKEFQIGTTSDEQGQFEIELASKAPLALISFMGYQPTQKVLTPSTMTLIKLSPEVIQFDSIMIFDQQPELSNNIFDQSIRLTVENVESIPTLTSSGDINRSIQLLPGINAFDDLSSRIKVRGGSADETMVLLNNMVLYNVDHFYGVFSSIQSSIIDETRVYKNIFPIEYSGYTSSVVEINSIPEITEVLNAEIQLDLISTSGLLNIPIRKNMGLMLAARTTYQDIANSSIFDILQSNRENLTTTIDQNTAEDPVLDLVDVRPSFHFRDLFTKWQWKIDKRQSLAINFFTGVDQYDYLVEQELEFSREFPRYQNLLTNSENASWTNQAIGLLYHFDWNKKFISQLNLNYSSYKLINDQEFTLSQNLAFRESRNRSFDINQNNEINGFRADLKNVWKNTNKGDLTFGFSLVENKVDLELQNNRIPNQDLFNVAQQNIVYAYQSINLLDKFKFGFGTSATYYNGTNKLYLSPRLSIHYLMSDQLYFKSSVAKYFQFLRQLYYEDPFGENQILWMLARSGNGRRDSGIPVIEADHLMIGGHLSLNTWSFDIELFQKVRQGVVEYALVNPGFNNNRLNLRDNLVFTLFNGSGLSKGIDILIQKNLKNYQSWIAYTLSETTHQFAAINGNNPYPAQDDRRHQLKWINQYHLNKWTFSSTYVFASGRPYLDISTVTTNPIDRRELNYESNIVRLIDYHRLDVGTSLKFNLFSNEAKASLSFINLLNRDNVKNRQYAFTIEPDQQHLNARQNLVIGTELKMLERLYNFSLQIKF